MIIPIILIETNNSRIIIKDQQETPITCTQPEGNSNRSSIKDLRETPITCIQPEGNRNKSFIKGRQVTESHWN